MNNLIGVSNHYKKPVGKAYFLSHSVGLMPDSTKRAIESTFLDGWHRGGEHIWPLWLDSINKFKASLGDLFNIEGTGFCPQSNVSSSLTKVMGALPVRRGKQAILMSEHDFPSMAFVVQQATKLGYQIKRIPKQANHQDVDVWNDHMTDDVGCVFVTHVHYNTNQLIHVDTIGQIARQKEIVSIVDVAQSVGIVPIDILTWDVDIVLGSCIKWLCGGPGAGFMWVHSRLVDSLSPTDVGWFSHENPFEFDVNNFEYASGSTRFWGGTPSVLPYVIAANSIEQQLKIGIGNIRRHNQALCLEVMSHINEGDIVSPLDVKQKGGTLVLKFDHQEQVIKQLTDANILFDSREYGLRLSPHIYNDCGDIEKLIQCFT
jgi:selenocysteine lyase/cysteine desulfurase